MRFFVSLLLGVGTLIHSLPVVAQSDGEHDSFRRARSFHLSDQPDSVAYYARRAIAQWQQQRQWNQQAYGLAWLGDLFRREERNDSAFYYLSRALVSVTSNPVQDTTRAQVYQHLGDYYRATRQPAQAVQMFQRAAAVQKSFTDPLPLIESYTALGSVYRYAYFDHITAQQYYQQALRLLEETGEHDGIKLFNVLYNLATTSRLQQDHEQALAYGYRAATLAKSFRSEHQEVCYTMLGNILNDQRNYAAAIYNFQRALALGEERLGNDDPALIIRLNNLASVYAEVDSVPKSVRLLDHALQIYQASEGQGEHAPCPNP